MSIVYWSPISRAQFNRNISVWMLSTIPYTNYISVSHSLWKHCFQLFLLYQCHCLHHLESCLQTPFCTIMPSPTCYNTPACKTASRRTSLKPQLRLNHKHFPIQSHIPAFRHVCAVILKCPSTNSATRPICEVEMPPLHSSLSFLLLFALDLKIQSVYAHSLNVKSSLLETFRIGRFGPNRLKICNYAIRFCMPPG